MQISFSELKAQAVQAAEKTFPPAEPKTGAALLCRDGRIYTGSGVTFADGTVLSACDRALAAALSDGKTKFLAAAFCTDTLPDKGSFIRLAAYGDMMVCLTAKGGDSQTTLKKLILSYGE